MYHFDKTRRLLNKNQYNFVFEKANRTLTPEFTILHRANDLGSARLGLALSKKMIPKAHDRNRIKRLLRESFRTTGLPAADIVFLAKQGVAKIDNSSITTRLGKAWEKVIDFYAN